VAQLDRVIKVFRKSDVDVSVVQPSAISALEGQLATPGPSLGQFLATACQSQVVVLSLVVLDLQVEGNNHEGSCEENLSCNAADSAEQRARFAGLRKRFIEDVAKAINFPGMKLKDLWPLIADKYADAFPQMLRLTSAAMAVPMSSSDCERGFSTQNCIKRNQRSSLGSSRFDVLMQISMEGPPINFINAGYLAAKAPP
jgi:hypothetical protein